MRYAVKHDLDGELLHRTIEAAFSSYQQRYPGYDPSLIWTSATQARIGFRARGMAVSGNVDMHPGELDVDLDLPLVFRVFKKRALAVVDAEVQGWIRRAKAGEI